MEKDNTVVLESSESGFEPSNDGKTDSCNLGKFKDTDALLNAYNSLQAEFTRRSQRLKELEGQVGKNENNTQIEISQLTKKIPILEKHLTDENSSVEECITSLVAEVEALNKIVANCANEEDSTIYDKAKSRDAVKDRIISDYLSSLNSIYSVPLLDGKGTTISSPVQRPTTIEQAGIIATQYLKKQ